MLNHHHRQLSTLRQPGIVLSLVLCLCLCAPPVALGQQEEPASQPASEPASQPASEPASQPDAAADLSGASQPAPRAEEQATLKLPRHFAFGFALIKELGFGGLIRGRYKYVGFDASVGAMPYFILTSGACDDLIGGVALHVVGSFLAYFQPPERKFQNGLRVGGIWNQLFGPGVLVGWQGELNLSRRWAIQFGGGLQVFWDAKSGIEEKMKDACGSYVKVEVSPILSTVQPYIGVNILVYII